MNVGVKVSQPHHYPSLVISQVWLSPGQQEAFDNQTSFPLTKLALPECPLWARCQRSTGLMGEVT